MLLTATSKSAAATGSANLRVLRRYVEVAPHHLVCNFHRRDWRNGLTDSRRTRLGGRAAPEGIEASIAQGTAQKSRQDRRTKESGSALTKQRWSIQSPLEARFLEECSTIGLTQSLVNTNFVFQEFSFY